MFAGDGIGTQRYRRAGPLTYVHDAAHDVRFSERTARVLAAADRRDVTSVVANQQHMRASEATANGYRNATVRTCGVDSRGRHPIGLGVLNSRAGCTAIGSD